ncbi:MAG: hypothetical protein ACREFL_06590 [Stellaceae bacterium]
MKTLVCRLFAGIAALLGSVAPRRRAAAPPARPADAAIGAAVSRYWIAPSAKPATGGQVWSVHCDNRADIVATGLSLAQARTLCGLLNRMGGFAASERRLSAGVKPPRIQSPDV